MNIASVNITIQQAQDTGGLHRTDRAGWVADIVVRGDEPTEVKSSSWHAATFKEIMLAVGSIIQKTTV